MAVENNQGSSRHGEARKAELAAYHANFELIRTSLGFQARHKVTGQSYQAHDIAQEPQRQVERTIERTRT